MALAAQKAQSRRHLHLMAENLTKVVDDVKLKGKLELGNLETARFKDGYRDGVSEGEESTLQAGFDCGYETGFYAVKHVAYVKGILWALKHTGEHSLAAETLESLLQEVVDMEGVLTDDIRKKCPSRQCGSTVDVVQEAQFRNRLDDIIETCSHAMSGATPCRISLDKCLLER